MGWSWLWLMWALCGLAAPWPVVLPEGVAFEAPPRSAPWSGALRQATALAIDPDGALLAIDGARLLRLARGETAPAVLRADLPPLCALGPRGELACVQQDVVSRLDPASAAPMWQRPARGATLLAWSSDGGSLVLGGNNNITALSARSGETQEAPDSRTARYVYAATQQRLAHITGGRLEIYDQLGAGRLLEAPQGDRITELVLSPDGRWLAERREVLRLWDADKRSLAAEISDAGAFAFADDGRLAVARAGGIELRAPGGVLVSRLPMSRPATRLLYDDAAIVLFSAEGLRRLPLPTPGVALNLIAGEVLSAAIHPDGSRLALGTELGLLQIWSVQGELLSETRAPGPARSLRWSADGRALVAMAPSPLRWSGDGLSPCPPNEVECGAAKAPPPPGPDPRTDGPLLAEAGGLLVEAVERGVRLHLPGGETRVLWPGPDGRWATWIGGQLRWGGAAPAFLRDGQPIEPPAEDFILNVRADPARIFDGDAGASLSVRVKNNGPGRAFYIHATAGGVESEPVTRLDAGQEVALLLPVPARPGEVVVTAMAGTPVSTPYTLSSAPWPLAIKKVKRKGQSLKIQLDSAGGDTLGGAVYWLSATDRDGERWAVASGPTGRLAPWTPGQPAPAARDGQVFPPKGKIVLEYRLPDKGSTELRLWVQPHGGAPRAMGL